MKNFIIIFISSVVIFSLGYILDSDSIPEFDESAALISESIEMELPDFNFTSIDNKKFSIKDFKGKTVMLNFWATWCGPCLEEFPEILKVLHANKDDMILVAISNDTNKKDILKFLKKFKKDLSILSSNIIIGYDPKKDISSSLFNILKLPETFVLNKEGKIIKKIVGAQQWSDGKLLDFFSQL